VERRAGAGEEWLAATKHYGAEVESIFINKAKLGQTPCQLRSGDFDLPVEPGLQPPHRRLIHREWRRPAVLAAAQNGTAAAAFLERTC